ncbi:MAG: hypothetical protein Q9174_000422 [Haloplaca sp. 1 TL-2023]
MPRVGLPYEAIEEGAILIGERKAPAQASIDYSSTMGFPPRLNAQIKHASITAFCLAFGWASHLARGASLSEKSRPSDLTPTTTHPPSITTASSTVISRFIASAISSAAYRIPPGRAIDTMPAPYEIRAGGDVKNKKQSMADLKLRRLNELNSRLREDLERPRIRVSEASMSSVPSSYFVLSIKAPRCGRRIRSGRDANQPSSDSLIQYCQNTKDFMVPSIWGQVDKREDPYAPQQPNGCCSVM